ncbi:MAG: tryptophan--tRNA ligase [Clostridia bacterium]|nr:tryptophan--tRNA ligase [Clostridia bacterium]
MARVFSGVQPTGEAHIGNYLGAFRHWRPDPEHMYCIVDLHAITVEHDPEALERDTRFMAGLLVALGLHEGSILFAQSDVPAHVEMMWLLTSVATVGELERMTQFKAKARALGRRAGIPAGLLMYPVLMAADILLYRTDEVPVGEDQKQHVELARDLAERFNRRYGETFVLPKPAISPVAARIKSLSDPTRKMSKSDADPDSKILVTDPPDVIRRKVMAAVTDSGREVYPSPEKPGITNLLEIMSGFTGRPVEALVAEYRDGGYGRFKRAVAEAVVEGLRPLQAELARVLADPGAIERILAEGARRASERAEPVLRLARERMGFPAVRRLAAGALP